MVASFLLLLGAASLSQAKQVTTQLTDHLPGQLLIKLKSSTTPLTAQSSAMTSIIKKLGANAILSVRPLLTDKAVQVIRLSKTADEDLSAAITALKSNPQVQYAEPNFVLHALDDGVPNDPEFYKMWAMHNTGQTDIGGSIGVSGADINILPLWKEGFTGSRKVLVAVLDTGMDWNHPDLQANLYTNPGEIAGNGVDDDHNGFVDDVHGWNFYDNNNIPMDDHNHGTHCAGIIGAAGNNSVGIAGINWNVSLMPLKFLSSQGSGSTDKAIDAINYATMMKVNVMSNSWGGNGWSQGMYDAIKHARDGGVLFVAAAGNEAHNNDDEATYPAGFELDNVVSVAATDNRDKLGIFSNYGQTTVHVAAPGVRIWSTVRGGDYASMSGTSMATPFAAGVAALVMSAHPELSYSEVKDRLIRTSTPVASLRTKVVAKGRINAFNAMHDVVPPAIQVDKTQVIE